MPNPYLMPCRQQPLLIQATVASSLQKEMGNMEEVWYELCYRTWVNLQEGDGPFWQHLSPSSTGKWAGLQLTTYGRQAGRTGAEWERQIIRAMSSHGYKHAARWITCSLPSHFILFWCLFSQDYKYAFNAFVKCSLTFWSPSLASHSGLKKVVCKSSA